MEQQQPPAGQPAPAQGGWSQPPAPPPAAWAQPAAQRQGGTTVLAKIGGLILFLWGLLFTLLGLLAVAGGALFKDALKSLAGQDVESGQLGDVLGGAIVVLGIVILVVAILEMLVGVFAFKGSGFARVLGILYGLFFGVIMLLGSVSPRDLGDGSGGGVFGLVLAGTYLYTAIVFIVAYRSRA